MNGKETDANWLNSLLIETECPTFDDFYEKCPMIDDFLDEYSARLAYWNQSYASFNTFQFAFPLQSG